MNNKRKLSSDDDTNTDNQPPLKKNCLDPTIKSLNQNNDEKKK